MFTSRQQETRRGLVLGLFTFGCLGWVLLGGKVHSLAILRFGFVRHLLPSGRRLRVLRVEGSLSLAFYQEVNQHWFGLKRGLESIY